MQGDDAAQATQAALLVAERAKAWGAFMLLQGLSAAMLATWGHHSEALGVLCDALRCTPCWHPTSAHRALQAIADSLPSRSTNGERLEEHRQLNLHGRRPLVDS